MDIVYATSSASLILDGASVFLRQGTHWPADDPIVKAHPGFFSDDPRYGLSWTGTPPSYMAEPPVEQATRNPGERRNIRRVGSTS